MATSMTSPGPRAWSFHPWLWIAAAALLMVPAAAMMLGAPGVAWNAFDFLVMGALLAAACGLVELGLRAGTGLLYRAAFALAVVTGFMTVWVNLAVGMLASEGHPASLMFGGVLAVAVVGTLLARFRAPAMALAMAAAGVAQLAAAGVAVAMGGFQMLEIVLTACFALPWFASAVLFARST